MTATAEDLPTLQAKLVALRQAELDAMIGRRVTRITYSDGQMEFASFGSVKELLAEIRAAISRTIGDINRLACSQLTGGVIDVAFR